MTHPIFAFMCQRLDVPLEEPVEKGTEFPVRLEHLLYAFMKGATTPPHVLILAPWVSRETFSQERIYFRTPTGLYGSHETTLRDFLPLVPDTFCRVNKSTLVNLAMVSEGRISGTSQSTLGFDVPIQPLTKWGYEQVKVGREYLQDVRQRFGHRYTRKEVSHG